MATQMMTDRRHEPAPPEYPEGALLGGVENDRVFRRPVAYKRHDAVAARFGPLHGAAVAIDGERCHTRQVVTGQ